MHRIDKKRNNRVANFAELLNSPRCSDDDQTSRIQLQIAPRLFQESKVAGVNPIRLKQEKSKYQSKSL